MGAGGPAPSDGGTTVPRPWGGLPAAQASDPWGTVGGMWAWSWVEDSRVLSFSWGLVEARHIDGSTGNPAKKTGFLFGGSALARECVSVCVCAHMSAQACTVDRDLLQDSPVTGVCIFLQLSATLCSSQAPQGLAHSRHSVNACCF